MHSDSQKYEPGSTEAVKLKEKKIIWLSSQINANYKSTQVKLKQTLSSHFEHSTKIRNTAVIMADNCSNDSNM